VPGRCWRHCVRAVVAARAAGLPVIDVQVAFRSGSPEISRANRASSAIAASATMGVDDAATQIHPAAAPQAGDVVVIEKRVSALSGSDLEVVLGSAEVDAPVLTGNSTSGVVLRGPPTSRRR